MGSKRRFLRDLILDEMLQELRDIQRSVECCETELPSDLDPIFRAALELYETNRVALKHIETVIEAFRRDQDQATHLDQLTMAMTHLRIGITGFHTVILQFFKNSTEKADSSSEASTCK